MNGTSTDAKGPRACRRFILFAVVLGAVLAVLFSKSFLPHYVLFANDAQLGMLKADENLLPQMYSGWWQNLTWLGAQAPSAAPNITNFMQMIFPAEFYLKIYAPFTMFFVGFCAWLFFRQLGFNPAVCLMGGLAAGINMHFFSTACWGLGSWNLAFGCIFLALAALTTKTIKQKWAAAILAGLAVGMNLMEGFDSGAICSVFVGLFVLFNCFQQSDASVPKKIANTVWIGALVVIFSALIATHSIVSLVGTQVTGISGMKQDTVTKQGRWYEATQWSLPKQESLRILIPGFFGYRMEGLVSSQDKSGTYWGHIGRDPHLDSVEKDLKSPDEKVREEAKATMARSGYSRHTGSGDYAGVLVALMAVFAMANSLRKNNSPLQAHERRAVWFWTGVAFISLLASWGRHGFLYQMIFQIPGVSAIRNPIKWLHPFHIAWIILSAYGMEALFRGYLQNAMTRLNVWKSSGFEKKWALGFAAVVVLVLGAFFVFAGSKPKFEYLLKEDGFPELAPQMANFCFSEVGWFIAFLLLNGLLLIWALSGAWSGARSKILWIMLGAILVVDLGRSNLPWIQYWDYTEKYSPNPIVEFLRDKPHEHRMSARAVPNGPYDLPRDNNMGGLLFFWLQNDFPANNIQALDIIQMPRMPEIDKSFIQNFYPKGNNDLSATLRLWQLTNTRYVIAYGGFFSAFNEQSQNAFQIRALFNMVPKPGLKYIGDAGDLTIELNTNKGPFALLEYTNVLPRVKLFSNWQSPTNDAATLETLVAKEFDPMQTVLVARDHSLAPPKNAGIDPGTASIVDYKPKHIKVSANVKTDAVLILNEKIAPDWHVTVDGKPAELLRCNFIMRGVALDKGEHTVEFKFQPPLRTLYVSLAAWGIGVVLAGFLIASKGREKKAATPEPKPASEEKPANL